VQCRWNFGAWHSVLSIENVKCCKIVLASYYRTFLKFSKKIFFTFFTNIKTNLFLTFLPLDPDPDSESGSKDLIESGSGTLVTVWIRMDPFKNGHPRSR